MVISQDIWLYSHDRPSASVWKWVVIFSGGSMPLEFQDCLIRETPSPYQTDCITNFQTMIYGPGAIHHMCCTLILQAGEITLEFNSLRMFLCTVNRFLNLGISCYSWSKNHYVLCCKRLNGLGQSVLNVKGLFVYQNLYFMIT